MKKLIFYFLFLLILTSSAFAWGHPGYHRGGRIIIAPPIIVRPPLHCEYFPHVIRFATYPEALRWVNENRPYLYDPTIHMLPGYFEVWYAEEFCS